MILTILDIIGATTGISGAILVGKKHYMGYVLFAISNTCYGTLGIIEGHIGLVALSIVAIAIDIYFWRKWKQDHNTILDKPI